MGPLVLGAENSQLHYPCKMPKLKNNGEVFFTLSKLEMDFNEIPYLGNETKAAGPIRFYLISIIFTHCFKTFNGNLPIVYIHINKYACRKNYLTKVSITELFHKLFL
jgi:hypothetical protein